MEGLLEILFFLGFLYWFWPRLFIEGASRANKMVAIVTNHMLDSFERLTPTERNQQPDSLLTITDMKRFAGDKQLRKQNKEAEIKLRDSHLYDIKENSPQVMLPANRPLMGLACHNCTPSSKGLLVNTTVKNLGLKNILTEYPAALKQGFLYQTFAHFSQVYDTKSFKYVQVAGSILDDERVKNAIDKTTIQQFQDSESSDEEFYQQLWKNNQKRAKRLLKDMRSTLSNFLLKCTSWVLYKLLPCFLNSIVVHSGQIEMLKRASESGMPLIFLPLHRSHLDYVMISFILQNNSVRCPLIAAGDNLRMPFFGSLLRGLGAFYIKRRMDPVMGQKDYVYKAILHSYMNASLQANHNLEFFLEGGRTRTGKPLMPKYGIFSIVLDAFMNGAIDDALLVPVSINYEKLVDGNFIREQLGQPKQMETFASALKSIWQVLNSNYGMVRIDFNQPFSLKELTKTFNNGKIQNSKLSNKLKSNPSTTSLYGTDIVSDEHKYLVENISKHVLYDCAHSTSVMSTNAIAFLLLHKFRQGVNMEQLTAALEELRSDLTKRQIDVGFTGDSFDVITYGLDLLGPGLVRKEKVNNVDIIKPVVHIPNVIELNYYSNTLTTFYCLESVIGIALKSLDLSTGYVIESDLIEACVDLCNILQYEFVFCKPCQDLESSIFDCIEYLLIYKDIFILKNGITKEAEQSQRLAQRLFDSEETETYQAKQYRINEKKESQYYISFVSSLLMPLIESYSVTALCLYKLVGRTLLESDFIKEVLDEIRLQLDSGALSYHESLSSDSIRNALKFFQKVDVVECHNQNKLKVYYLNEAYDNEQSVNDLYNNINKYVSSFEYSN